MDCWKMIQKKRINYRKFDRHRYFKENSQAWKKELLRENELLKEEIEELKLLNEVLMGALFTKDIQKQIKNKKKELVEVNDLIQLEQ